METTRLAALTALSFAACIFALDAIANADPKALTIKIWRFY
jgi:hypothetical protein